MRAGSSSSFRKNFPKLLKLQICLFEFVGYFEVTFRKFLTVFFFLVSFQSPPAAPPPQVNLKAILAITTTYVYGRFLLMNFNSVDYDCPHLVYGEGNDEEDNYRVFFCGGIPPPSRRRKITYTVLLYVQNIYI